jgi:hypothetical protein
MRSTLRRSFAAFALAALAVASNAVLGAASYVRKAVNAVCGFMVDAVATFERPQLQLAPRVELVQACAYGARLVKRERPHVEGSSWRMCPSC